MPAPVFGGWGVAVRTRELEKAEGVSGPWAREWVTLEAAAGLFFTQFICSLNMSKCWGCAGDCFGAGCVSA